MPEISKFFGISIKIFFNDHNPPHFHAQYQGKSAIYNIKTGKKKDGNLPKNAEKIVEEWARQYKEDLLKNWERMRKGLPPFKIPGADQ